MKPVIFVSLLLLPSLLLGESPAVVALQRIALAENPRLRALESEVQMMKRSIPRSDAIDDPKLKLGFSNVPVRSPSLTREEMTAAEIGISQMIPLGKLPYRRRIAVMEYEKAAARLSAERVETLHLLRVSLYEIAYVDSSRLIMEEIRKHIRLVAEREIAAAKAGTGAVGNVIKAEIEQAMVDGELITLAQRRRELEERIHYLAGRRTELDGVKFAARGFHDSPMEGARDAVAASNPGLRLARLDMDITGSELLAAKAEYAPDIDLGISYMHRRDSRRRNFAEPMITSMGAMTVFGSEKMRRDDMVSAMVTVSVPFWFWKKNIPAVDEMRKKNEAAKNRYRDMVNELHARAETLAGELDSRRALHDLYRGRLIPRVELALETILARYRTGAVEFMPVIDTVRLLLRYRRELIAAEMEYHAAYSELNALMGVEVLQ